MKKLKKDENEIFKGQFSLKFNQRLLVVKESFGGKDPVCQDVTFFQDKFQDILAYRAQVFLNFN